MNPKVGDTVYVEGCVFNTGTHYIKKYKLLRIAPEHLDLELLSTLTKDGEQPENGKVERFDEPDKTLAWLARPIQERFKQHAEDTNYWAEWIVTGK